MSDISKYLEIIREKCPYYSYEDVTPWHGDVFDHPNYQTFCSKNGEKEKIFQIQCFKCSVFKNNIENEMKGNK